MDNVKDSDYINYLSWNGLYIRLSLFLMGEFCQETLISREDVCFNETGWQRNCPWTDASVTPNVLHLPQKRFLANRILVKFNGLPCFSNQVFLSGSKWYNSGFLSGPVGGRSTSHVNRQPRTPVWSSRSWTEKWCLPKKYRSSWQIDNCLISWHVFDTTFIQYTAKLFCVRRLTHLKPCTVKWLTLIEKYWKRTCKLKILQQVHWLVCNEKG